MLDDKLPTMTDRFPYAISGNGVSIVDFTALDKMNLHHLTDYIYWKRKMRFKDAEKATMYKLMQNI
jgi:hypothetical protein|tara:strand:+ start:221 stop:418 length:198 start_codon:yes stop_codon:yes gene_type:complete